MKVHLVLGTSAGGVGSHVRDLVRTLSGARHDVSVSGPEQVLRHFDLAAAGARVQAVDIRDRPALSDRSAVAQLRHQLAGADVVHAHGLRAGALAALALRARRTPLVVTLHNASPGGAVKGRVFSVLEGIVARRAQVVLGVSADLVERMRALGARQVALAVVPAPPARSALRTREQVRAELGVAPGTALVVSVGRLAPQKHYPTLLRALADLQDLDLLVAVAGEGPLHAELAATAREEGLPLLLLGQRSDVPDLLAAADVVVSTATWEGQPVWLQEALQAGAAVVATDAGGTGAVLGDAATLVPVGDSDAVAQAIRAVVTNDGRRVGLRERARRRAEELPTQQDALDAALAAYAHAMT